MKHIENMCAVLLYTMTEQLIPYIAQYGYLAILALVFLQEVGIPCPIPNEFVLLFSGYLSYTGLLKLSLVILSAVVGDLLASFILFELFYFFGKSVLNRKPKWLPISVEKMERIKLKLEIRGLFGMYVGRVTPFIKGYVSVLCGLLRMPQKKYGLVLVVTSVFWSMAYVGVGFLTGPYFKEMSLLTNRYLLMLPILFIIVVLLIQLFKKKSIV
jgi:membrane protein DedA with SNARE-associated domain